MGGKRVYAGKKGSKTRSSKKKKTNYISPSVSGKRVVSSVSGPGTRLKARFTYADRLALTGGIAGVASTYIFRINSLFDPDFAFGGHQPAGFDQLMAIYEHYCVTECEYKVIFNSSAAVGQMIVGCNVSDNSTSSTDHRTYVENGINQQDVITGADGGGVKSLKGTINIADLMGVSQATLLKDDTFWGSATQDPADQAYLKIYTADVSTANGDTIGFQVELNFSAVLMGGRFLSLS